MNGDEMDYDPEAMLRVYGGYPSSCDGMRRGTRLIRRMLAADGPAPGALEAAMRAQRGMGFRDGLIDEMKDERADHTPIEELIPADVPPGSGHARRVVYSLIYAALCDG